MRQDMLAGRSTEIDYINGYIIARGAQNGYKCDSNRALAQLIHDRTTVSDDVIPMFFPDVKLS